jgi:hypothetical protein
MQSPIFAAERGFIFSSTRFFLSAKPGFSVSGRIITQKPGFEEEAGLEETIG